jgi:sialate O-acetylesterase
MRVRVDTGDAENIHPPDKQLVGERAALAALGGTYGFDIIWRGPTYASHETIPGAIKVRFLHTDGGLVVQGDDPVGEFAIAGTDRVWHWATAKIDGNHIIVSSPDVPDPVAVRYAWQANPLANLYNGGGLPAVPFRTDDWPGATE